MMCRVLEVSRSSYYHWRKNPIGKRADYRIKTERLIQQAYTASKGRNGSPRIAKDLESQGVKISRKTVAKYMRRIGLRSKLARKYKPTTDSSHREPVAENLLNRDFISLSPATKCVSDITYIQTKEGFLYLTVIIDLFDRDVIGWTLSDGMTARETVIAALEKAAKNRCFQQNMMFHSDRGVQYACKATVNTLKSYSITQSMSRKGNCWDNAVAESFFKSLKTELIYGQKLMPKEQIRLEIFEYIEIWYRKKRRHSYLDYNTITEFNQNYQTINNDAA